jgi:nicotinate-nucleotide--dimethylbenzimidazole phosphoribosyltransferase
VTEQALVSGSRALHAALVAIADLGPLDASAMAAANAHLDQLTKPPGSLGRLEALAVTLAGIRGQPAPPLSRRAIVVAAADHGVARRGVSAYPSEVTAQMVANFVAGGAAICVLAEQIGAEVTVIDVGVAAPIPAVPAGRRGARLVSAPIRPGTADMTVEPAMAREEAVRAIDIGLAVAAGLAADGVDVIAVGEMGIGNTTAASALVAVLADVPVEDVAGRGTGLDDGGVARKIDALRTALARHAPDRRDPLGALAAVGGLEIACLVGVILGAVAVRRPVVLDGFITGAAALVAQGLAPTIAPRLIAGHRSQEPGHAVALERLGLAPLLSLDLRLGEGSGAALALGLLDAAVAIRDGMATFASAGIAGPE